jgi:hypothetical protein
VVPSTPLETSRGCIYADEELAHGSDGDIESVRGGREGSIVSKNVFMVKANLSNGEVSGYCQYFHG